MQQFSFIWACLSFWSRSNEDFVKVAIFKKTKKNPKPPQKPKKNRIWRLCCCSSSNFISNKKHENTHKYNTFTVVNTQKVRMYCVSGCQKMVRLIELAAATGYLQFCHATAGPDPEEMTPWHPGGRFKESSSSNGFHNIYSVILLRIISRYMPFHQMSF